MNDKKARIIAIANQKGGVAKSTTTLALAAGLARRGGRVLIVDADAQGNTTTVAGGDGEPDLFDVLTGKAKAAAAVHDTQFGAVDDTIFGARIIPAGRRLFVAEAEVENIELLRDALQSIRADYDYIIIDTPPALGILTANALTAADGVIIPANAELFGLQGIAQLKKTIDAVKLRNPNLAVYGILLTRHKANTRLMNDMADMAGRIAADMGTVVYKAKIRDSVGVKEAQAARRPLQDYKAAKGATEDYETFIGEFLAQTGGAK